MDQDSNTCKNVTVITPRKAPESPLERLLDYLEATPMTSWATSRQGFVNYRNSSQVTLLDSGTIIVEPKENLIGLSHSFYGNTMERNISDRAKKLWEKLQDQTPGVVVDLFLELGESDGNA